MSDIQKNPAPAQPQPLKEGVDYYLEKGYWVFTQHYLLRRGYCCGNGCRHCPYGSGETKTKPQKEAPDTPRQ